MDDFDVMVVKGISCDEASREAEINLSKPKVYITANLFITNSILESYGKTNNK